MIPWILLDTVQIPESDKELRLYQRDKEYSIKINSSELMNSRVHSSEDALGRLACLKITNQKKQKILIGGLGMGFTLRAALNNLKGGAQVTVAELIPSVVKWNNNFLVHLAKNPLKDKRVTVYEGDVVDKINTAENIYHAILLDVDNGAQGLTQKKNDSLYTLEGLKSAYDALQPQGVLAVWSAGLDKTFTRRLRNVKFQVEEIHVPTYSKHKGGMQYVVWIAIK